MAEPGPPPTAYEMLQMLPGIHQPELGEPRHPDGFFQMLWPDEKRGPWCIRANWVEVEGRLECIGLTIWHGAWQDLQDILKYRPIPGTEPTPITATDLRALPIGGLIGDLRRHAVLLEQRSRSVVGSWHWLDDEERAGLMRPELFATDEPRAGRRPVYGPEHFVEVARTYLEAWDRGDKPTKAVAEAFNVTRSAAAKWVARAREMGLLGVATRGRAGSVRPRDGSQEGPK